MIDRLSIRTRPAGWPVMYQTWGKLLFLHWPVAAELLQPLIAPGLQPRHLRGPGLGERDAFHHVGDSAHLLSPASRAEPIA